MRSVEHYVHGNGQVVIVPARVCAYLNRYAGLAAFHREYRGADKEVDDVLVAFQLAELAWRSSATGTKKAAVPELARDSEWLSTTQAAGLTGNTDRGIRKAIAEGRIKAERVADRWRISRENLEHYKSQRPA